MHNSMRAPMTRSLRSDDIRTYLNDRARECDDQIDELHQRIRERKRLSQTAPLPMSSSSPASLRSQCSASMKAKHTSFQVHSDGNDDFHYHSAPRPRIKPSAISQRVSSSNRTIKPSSSPPPSPERPLSISQKQQQQRGILKKPKGDAPRSPTNLKETPEQWFQRIMKIKQLSPLDLCDLFSFGDARKYPRVPLSHVCGVLFDLDPEVVNSGYDPVTPEMEEFLYQFSFEGSDREGENEIVVNVKDALRPLNIWQSGVTSPVKKNSGFTIAVPTESGSPTKSIMLEAKNKKLQGVISSLQDADLRLSQQLDDAAKSSKSSEPTSDFKAKAHQQRHPFSTSSSLNSSVFSSSSWLPSCELNSDSASSANSSKLTLKSSVVNHHEDELVKIANHLQ